MLLAHRGRRDVVLLSLLPWFLTLAWVVWEILGALCRCFVAGAWSWGMVSTLLLCVPERVVVVQFAKVVFRSATFVQRGSL